MEGDWRPRGPARLALATLAMAIGCDAHEASLVAQATPTPSPTHTTTAPTPPLPTATPASKVPALPLTVRVEPTDLADLQARALSMPVQGVHAAALRDTFGDRRSLGSHEALDIPAPLRTPVFAVEDGVVAKLFTSQRGGLTLYQFDPGSRYAYYYAHLDAYAPGLREGQPLKRCALLGYVGMTGNAPAGSPHLHFAIFKLEENRRWWRGAPVNPHPVLRASSAAPCPSSAGG